MVVVAGCASSPQGAGSIAAPTTTIRAATAPSPAPAPTAATTLVPGTVTSAVALTIPAFAGTAVRVTAADLPSSWRAGCPVAPSDLRRLELSYWGFDDRAHSGALVVNAAHADAIIGVFRRLYERRFPIRRMEPIDAYGGSDDASIAADNTAGFNCRNAVTTGPPHWSAHAYGLAIDVNPVENPYLLDGAVLPPAGAAYTDRSNVRPGMAVRGGELVAAFAAAGWSWGGVWADSDYQHFSATGN